MPKKLEKLQTLEDSFDFMINSKNFIQKSMLFDFTCSNYDHYFNNTKNSKRNKYSENFMEYYVDDLRKSS